MQGVQAGSYGGHREHLRARYRVYTVRERGGERPAIVDSTLRVWDPEREGFVEDGRRAA